MSSRSERDSIAARLRAAVHAARMAMDPKVEETPSQAIDRELNYTEIVSAAHEVLRLSDRDTDAWNRLRAALAKEHKL